MADLRGLLASADGEEDGILSKRIKQKLPDTFWGGLLSSAISGATYPGDVYAGKARPDDYGRALDTAGLVTLGSAAVPADINDLRMGMKLKHVSPHDFDKFKLNNKTRSTGEGFQKYGDGLYFSESDDVISKYDDMFKKRSGKAIKYDVDVAASPDDFLDLNKPINKQSDKIKRAILGDGGLAEYFASDKSISEALNKLQIDDYEKLSGEQFYALLDRLAGLGVLPANGPMNNVDGNTSAAASMFLKNEGINGLSQGIGKELNNYIVFDESIIDIVKKYGVVGALSMGAITLDQARQLADKKQFNDDYIKGNAT